MTAPNDPWTDEELIANARKLDPEANVKTVLDACEAYWGHGLADDACGEVEFRGHAYRVDRWIVETNDQGFHRTRTYPNEQRAHAAFERIRDELDPDPSEED